MEEGVSVRRESTVFEFACACVLYGCGVWNRMRVCCGMVGWGSGDGWWFGFILMFGRGIEGVVVGCLSWEGIDEWGRVLSLIEGCNRGDRNNCGWFCSSFGMVEWCGFGFHWNGNAMCVICNVLWCGFHVIYSEWSLLRLSMILIGFPSFQMRIVIISVFAQR